MSARGESDRTKTATPRATTEAQTRQGGGPRREDEKSVSERGWQRVQFGEDTRNGANEVGRPSTHARPHTEMAPPCPGAGWAWHTT